MDRLANDEHAATMARKYVWWQPAERTLEDPRILLAQMMTLGATADVRWLLSLVSPSDLRRVLQDPPVGVFNRRSWNFWRLRLGLAPVPLPTRRLPEEMPLPRKETARVTNKPHQEWDPGVHAKTLADGRGKVFQEAAARRDGGAENVGRAARKS